jgi:FkbM family methyltransferase
MSIDSYFLRLIHYGRKTSPQLCFGQDGEDLTLNRLLNGQISGFYVDIGAHHPMRFSNTQLFYLRGWNGINIDSEPGSMLPFMKYRKRDVNIECGVGEAEGLMSFYRFNDPALNTFDANEASKKNMGQYRIIDKINVQVRRLDDILDQHMPKGQTIDFMSIDVEGMDLSVLKSNNWDKYSPRYILTETLRSEMLHLAEDPVVKFLLDKNYRPVAKVYNTIFFEQN